MAPAGTTQASKVGLGPNLRHGRDGDAGRCTADRGRARLDHRIRGDREKPCPHPRDRARSAGLTISLSGTGTGTSSSAIAQRTAAHRRSMVWPGGPRLVHRSRCAQREASTLMRTETGRHRRLSRRWDIQTAEDIQRAAASLRSKARLSDALLKLKLSEGASLADRITATAALEDRLAHETLSALLKNGWPGACIPLMGR